MTSQTETWIDHPSRYGELADHIAAGRNPDYRKLANNTFAEYRENGSIAVRLHKTDVLTYDLGGNVVFDSGGWQTVTTKSRMNTFGPTGYGISQTNHVWHLYRYGQTLANGNNPRVRYFDGLELDPKAGTILNIGDSPNWEGIDKVNKQTARLIREYVKGITPELLTTLTGAGDCLYCAGNFSSDTGHLFSHLREKYYMASLVRNAMRAVGYADFQIAVNVQFAPDNVKRAVRKYLTKQLVTPNG